jgi:hypothetical protein
MAVATHMQGDMDTPCDGCASPQSAVDQISNGCVLHCTADLQLTRSSESPVLSVIERPFFLISRIEDRSHARLALDGPPVGPPPRRILLHSFLI